MREFAGREKREEFDNPPSDSPMTRLRYESVSKSFRTGFPEWELQMVLFSAIILWVSLVSFAAITLVLLLSECLLMFISLSTQSGNFWIPPRTSLSFPITTAPTLLVTGIGNYTYIFVFELTGNRPRGDLGVYRKIMLKWMSVMLVMEIWIGTNVSWYHVQCWAYVVTVINLGLRKKRNKSLIW
jgi:hypothetical protein